MPKVDLHTAHAIASAMVASEFARQSRMWGSDNALHHDQSQLHYAAMAQLDLVLLKRYGGDNDNALVEASDSWFPCDWDENAFRDYGSDPANIAVGIAFLMNEMARLIAEGSDTHRTSRPASQQYVDAQPNSVEG